MTNTFLHIKIQVDYDGEYRSILAINVVNAFLFESSLCCIALKVKLEIVLKLEVENVYEIFRYRVESLWNYVDCLELYRVYRVVSTNLLRTLIDITVFEHILRALEDYLSRGFVT